MPVRTKGNKGTISTPPQDHGSEADNNDRPDTANQIEQEGEEDAPLNIELINEELKEHEEPAPEDDKKSELSKKC